MDPLDHLKRDRGCSMNWNQLAGDDKARHCSQCNKTVHNLSALPKSEARSLLAAGNGKLCIAFSYTPEGRLISPPEPPLLARWFPRLRRGLTFATGLFLAGCATSPSTPPPPVANSTCNPPDKKQINPDIPMYLGDEGPNYVECGSVPPEKQGTKGR